MSKYFCAFCKSCAFRALLPFCSCKVACVLRTTQYQRGDCSQTPSAVSAASPRFALPFPPARSTCQLPLPPLQSLPAMVPAEVPAQPEPASTCPRVAEFSRPPARRGLIRLRRRFVGHSDSSRLRVHVHAAFRAIHRTFPFASILQATPGIALDRNQWLRLAHSTAEVLIRSRSRSIVVGGRRALRVTRKHCLLWIRMRAEMPRYRHKPAAIRLEPMPSTTPIASHKVRLELGGATRGGGI